MAQGMSLSCLYNIKYSFCHVLFVMGKPDCLYGDSFHLLEQDQVNKLLQSESPVYGGKKIDQAQHVMQ